MWSYRPSFVQSCLIAGESDAVEKRLNLSTSDGQNLESLLLRVREPWGISQVFWSCNSIGLVVGMTLYGAIDRPSILMTNQLHLNVRWHFLALDSTHAGHGSCCFLWLTFNRMGTGLKPPLCLSVGAEAEMLLMIITASLAKVLSLWPRKRWSSKNLMLFKT